MRLSVYARGNMELRNLFLSAEIAFSDQVKKVHYGTKNAIVKVIVKKLSYCAMRPKFTIH